MSGEIDYADCAMCSSKKTIRAGFGLGILDFVMFRFFRKFGLLGRGRGPRALDGRV